MVVAKHEVRVRLIAMTAVAVMVGPALGVISADAAGHTWFHDAEMTAPDPIDGNRFGYAVEMQGDTIVVGEPKHRNSSDTHGVARVYTQNPSTGNWDHEANLIPPTRVDGDRFGDSVAIDGDTIVVGAPGDSEDANEGGAVHVFDRDPATGAWDHTARLVPDLPSVYAALGDSVAVEGDIIVAGAPGEKVGDEFYAGAVYVFRRDPLAGWQSEQRLTSAAPGGSDNLGTAVAIDGERIAAGAPGDGASDRGAVYAFIRISEKWGLQYKMTPPVGADDAYLGQAVDIEGDLIVAGSSFHFSGVREIVRVFRKVTGPISTRAWESVAELRSLSGQSLDPDDPIGDGYGGTLALHGSLLAVGAPLDDGDGVYRGAVYVYLGDAGGATWSLEQVLRLPGAADDQLFGASVAIDGSRVVGGASGWNFTSDPGEVHVFAPDLIAPTVSVVSPGDGARLAQGVPAAAGFSCSDAGSGIVSCVGTVADGAVLDTSELGSFTFAVTGTDAAGNSTTVSHSYEVVPACSGKPVTHVVPAGGVRFDGTGGPDVILGSDGPDVIYGLGGDDTVCGLGGDDVILGGPGDDFLLGGSGNDRLRGAAGDDTLLGEDGSDRLLPETGFDVVNGGAGSDIVDYLAGIGPVSVDLAAGTATYSPIGGGTWTHTLVMIEKADGTRYDDTLSGDWKRNVLRGKQGEDVISGAGGDDDLIGGTDVDEIYGGPGNDLVKGQAEDDVLWGDDDDDKLVGGNGNDALYGAAGNDVLIGGLRSHLGTFVNTLDGGAGTDTCRWEAFTTDCEP